MLEETGNFMSNPEVEKRGHKKEFSGPSSSIVTETSQSYASALEGIKKQFQSNNAATTTNEVEEVEDEDDEVEQLMQNYENLLGGFEMGQAARERIVTESSSPTHSTSRFKPHSGLQSHAASQPRLHAPSSDVGTSFQESVNGDKPIR